MMARLELGFPTDRLLELEQRLDVVGVSHTMVPSERRRARDLTATVFTMQCARGLGLIRDLVVLRVLKRA
jgi:hypothetical protein